MSPRPIARSILVAVAATALALAVSVAPALAVTASVSPTAPLVVIDPGHGGPFSNANGNGLQEKIVTLQIGLALRGVLAARGYRVIMTRTTDRALQTTDTATWNLRSGTTWEYARDKTLYYDESIPKDDLDARTRVANGPGADLFISIHCNGAESTSAHGTETWASPHDTAGQALAKLVQPAIVKRTGFHDRGTHTADFYVLRWTNMPAILVESAFISNKSDAAKLKTKKTRIAIARGIADGVDAFFASRPFTKKLARVSATSQVLTSIGLSKAGFASGASTVVLARCDEATDAPGVAALAVRLGAPLLLTSGKVPVAATVAEITRLDATKVLLVGVNGAFDESATADALKGSHVTSAGVASVEASDRAGLSAKIATKMGAPGTSGTVLLANAKDDRAIMALAPVSARTGSPILLTSDTSAGDCSAYLKAQAADIKRVIRAGCAHKPAAYSTTAKVVTLHYSDPVRISLALDAEAFTSRTAGSMTPMVLNCAKAGDVLSASVRAARLGRPVLVFRGRSMSPYTRLYITNRRTVIKTFSIVESNGSMPAYTETVLAKVDRR